MCKSISLLGLWFDALERFPSFGYSLWQWTGFSCAPYCQQVLLATHSWHIVGAELRRALFLEIDGFILTFLPCNVPSNLSLHKKLSQFPAHLSVICFNDVSTYVSYSLWKCEEAYLNKTFRFFSPFWGHFGFPSKPFLKEETTKGFFITHEKPFIVYHGCLVPGYPCRQ